MAGRVRKPGFWTVRTIGIAVRVLPPGPTRERYHREFLAELYGLRRLSQLHHALSLLFRSWALRVAIGDSQSIPATEVDTMIAVKPARLMCRINLHHRWIPQRNPDGDVYYRCSRCDKDRYDVETGDGPNVGGNIAGLGMSSGGA